MWCKRQNKNAFFCFSDSMKTHSQNTGNRIETPASGTAVPPHEDKAAGRRPQGFLQKTAKRKAKDGLLQSKRRPFAMQKTAFCNAAVKQRRQHWPQAASRLLINRSRTRFKATYKTTSTTKTNVLHMTSSSRLLSTM